MPSHQTIATMRDRHTREERRLILGALERCGWSLTRTAERLGIAVSSLQAMITRHALDGYYAERAPPRGRARTPTDPEPATQPRRQRAPKPPRAQTTPTKDQE